MPGRIHKRRPARDTPETEPEASATRSKTPEKHTPATNTPEKRAQEKADLDAFMEEVDELVAETIGDMTADQFVQGYVQKGGE